MCFRVGCLILQHILENYTVITFRWDAIKRGDTLATLRELITCPSGQLFSLR